MKTLNKIQHKDGKKLKKVHQKPLIIQNKIYQKDGRIPNKQHKTFMITHLKKQDKSGVTSNKKLDKKLNKQAKL